MKHYTGSCHCGGVKFEITAQAKELTTCDCTICTKKNALMLKVHQDQFTLLSGENLLSQYQFHTRTAIHYFCKVCGIYTFHRKRVTPDFYGINVFCLTGLDLSGIPIRATDGASTD